ncbi:polysaccharide deacetylase family protein [Luteolibacter flavescens]|uniref:Polysaccharide deacetylase family protein n=1 Tax=Luteolibacter flavescens TaxID=1859460 RepID=A0ABT3FLP2_9BACT|nr:polysaccharide deacetylase family protein [Luteolibacter flavescens]MCW1884502.1 polysaccharide deacetylase family protein [Luteolibacter flavescens]
MPLKKILLLALAAFALPASAETKRIAIIKADDVTGVNAKWERFFLLAEKHGVPVSAGVIGNSFEKQDAKYDEWLKKWEATGKVEFWNHGWDHRRWDENGAYKSEFSGSGYEHQKTHLVKTQEAGEAALGKPFIAFGTPFNDMDADTAKALNEIPQLKLFFCRPESEPAKLLEGKILLPMHLRGENDGTGKPNFAKFKEEYEKRKDDPSLTPCAFQFHPGFFSEAAFADFSAIVEFLKAEGWSFMLPADYAKAAGK